MIKAITVKHKILRPFNRQSDRIRKNIKNINILKIWDDEIELLCT